MSHKKLIRFEEIRQFPNVLERPTDMAGNWAGHFGNQHPITLELACGKGEYALGLARRHPERNFIGVDIKGNRIWRGAKTALEEGLSHVAFLRAPIDQLLHYFGPGEVSEIWITFPDPQLRISRSKKRLTHPRFLRLYQQILVPGGYIHLKTDSPDLYEFTRLVINKYGCNCIEDIANVYGQPKIKEELMIRTYYESLDIAGKNTVHYLCFSLPPALPGEDLDAELKSLLFEKGQSAH